MKQIFNSQYVRNHLQTNLVSPTNSDHAPRCNNILLRIPLDDNEREKERHFIK